MMWIAVLTALVFSTPTVDATPPSLNCIAVIGASASAGWGVVIPAEPGSEPVPLHHAHIDLADVLPAVLIGITPKITDHANNFFFSDPITIGNAEMSAAMATDPTLIVGVDFLFWYAYGSRPENTRLPLLELGLKELERFDGTLLVGDIPDVTAAASAKPIAFISTKLIPQPRTLDAINARIREWADARPRTHIIPLAGTLRSWQNGQPPHLNGHLWNDDVRIIQFDELHPTAAGLIAIAELVAESINNTIQPVAVQADPNVVLTSLRTKPTEIYK
jgi:hypothetical protein